MGEHGHGHGGTADDTLEPLPRRTRRALTAVVLVVLAAAVAGVLATWPHDVPSASTTYVGAQTVRGDVTATRMLTCRGELAEERLPDGTLPETVECPQATVRVDGTEQDATQDVTVTVPAAVFHGGLSAGDRVVLTRYPGEAGGAPTYAWEDVDRRVPLLVVVAVFVVLTVAVGRRRGLAALAGWPSVGRRSRSTWSRPCWRRRTRSSSGSVRRSPSWGWCST